MGRFGLSQPVPRTEDPRLLTGHGRYAGDVSLPGQVYALFLRSPHARAEIAAIDIEKAVAAPGVLAVHTGADVEAAGLGDLPCAVPVRDRNGQKLPSPGRPLLVRDRVRFVGDNIAMVVAETLSQARDALELISVDYAPLPAVATIEDAGAEGAPQVWGDGSGNAAFYWQSGDEAVVEDAFGHAEHVVRMELVNNRLVPSAMEPRAVVGDYHPASDRYTLYTSSQGAHDIKRLVAKYTLKVPEEAIRVIVGDVGGAFGSKMFHYAEEALALWTSARLGRPVKWVGDRAEAFTSDTHGRDQRNRVEAALDADGRILALRVHTTANMGAYLNHYAPAIPSQMTGCMLSGAYAIPAIFAVCEGVYTNTVPVDAYRGAGRPEAIYLVERLMEAVARQLGLPPEEIRRRNFIRPEQMPYATASGPTYDSGEFARNMDDAMAAADWAGFEARRAEALTRNRLRGIGMSTYVEICGFDTEEATVRVDQNGIVEILIGTQSSGQGHETAYAQIAAEALGVEIDRIRVVQGDTDRIPFGKGTSGSRSLPVGGPALQNAVDALIERGKTFAAHLLQARKQDIRFADGRYVVAHSTRSVGLVQLAAAAHDMENLPPGETMSELRAVARYSIEGSTFPNGCHICELEVDPETGRIEILAYHVVDDFGTIVNPLLLTGQVRGGIVQGIGQALMEEAVYDRESGQLISGSFLDYAIPHAAGTPSISVSYNSIPCTTNPLGIKGAGEAGTIAACPAVINAVVDALSPLGIQHIDMPATSEKIWRAIRAAH